MTFSVIARQFPVCDVRVSLGGSVRYYQSSARFIFTSLASSRQGPMDLSHSVFLKLSYKYLARRKGSTQMLNANTFGAPISLALPNARLSTLYEMIQRINTSIKSVSTLFYHLRATSLCFGDAHCSVTSYKYNIST
jgi:hypothetical protein